MGGIQLDGKPFELKQFHFHHPSEHALSGERTAMEAHFVHANEAGKLAVVGVLMKAGAHQRGLRRNHGGGARNRGQKGARRAA